MSSIRSGHSQTVNKAPYRSPDKVETWIAGLPGNPNSGRKLPTRKGTTDTLLSTTSTKVNTLGTQPSKSLNVPNSGTKSPGAEILARGFEELKRKKLRNLEEGWKKYF
jgi:hypothetical protein